MRAIFRAAHNFWEPLYIRLRLLDQLYFPFGLSTSDLELFDYMPLHTRAKNRDHEILRAQKKVSKGHPMTPPKSCSVVMDPQVYCEIIRDQSLNQMLFQ
jgi:hypothetical protein